MSDTRTEDLASFVTSMAGEGALRVEESLGSGFVRLRIAEAERRQAKHDIQCSEDIVIELLRNARDASARQLFCATSKEADVRTITMLDDGQGIPTHLWETVFEARVTSKLESVHMDRWGVHGRGMALYSIRENADDARVMASAVGAGTALRVVTDTSRLTERTDQSSWPKLGSDDQGKAVVESGPHNIIRTCCEFALEEEGRCKVYLGSPAEIVATLRSRAKASSPASLLVDDLSSLGVLERFAIASDARELAEVANGCGLSLSERTAHRILMGEIRPTRDVLGHLKRSRPRTRGIDLQRDRRGLRLSRDDAEEFRKLMERDFETLAERYYLSLTDAPKLRMSGSRLTVTFDFVEED